MEGQDCQRAPLHCCAQHPPPPPPRMLRQVTEGRAGGRKKKENLRNSVVRDEPGLGGQRLKLPSALKVSWGKHNGMLSFYWRINESEWK